MELERR
ncbi:hypothetical protein LINPERPRIM_LOCUS3940 [Linum perenne]